MPHDDIPSATGHGQKNLAAADVPTSVPGHSWLRNRFWLVLPVLALNAALTPYLPQGYAPASADIPAALTLTENVLRLLLCAVPLLMPLDPFRPVLLLYGCGITAYAGAWLAVMAAPDSFWSTGLIGFTAPAWTSLFWLAGIGHASVLRFMPRYRPWMFGATAIVFTAIHTLNTGLAWTQLA